LIAPATAQGGQGGKDRGGCVMTIDPPKAAQDSVRVCGTVPYVQPLTHRVQRDPPVILPSIRSTDHLVHLASWVHLGEWDSHRHRHTLPRPDLSPDRRAHCCPPRDQVGDTHDCWCPL
jgi:hypothetical protein